MSTDKTIKEPAALTSIEGQIREIEHPKPPWRKVTDADARRAIEGTALEPLVRLFESPMNPPLPLPAALLKAVVLTGCALSGQADEAIAAFPESTWPKTIRGHARARLRIVSARGQVCNVYGLLVAPSGCGKDIGSFADELALRHGWMIASGGSPEGLADILARKEPGRDKSNGLVSITEFSAWLDKRNWQSKAAEFLTASFSRGWFSIGLSTRGKYQERESMYCYPSILASIQPASIERYAGTIDLDSGFLGRFVIARMPDDYSGRPVCVAPFEHLIDKANASLDAYVRKSGQVPVGNEYLQDVFTEFQRCKAPIPAHWKRLVNEYGPRFAVMLSVRPGDLSSEVRITPDAWQGAAILIRWFYSQAEGVLSAITENEAEARLEKRLKRIRDAIQKHGPLSVREVSHWVSHGTTSKERREALDELMDRGDIELSPDERYSVTP